MRYGNRSIWKQISSSSLAPIVVLVIFCILAKAVWNINSKASTSANELVRAEMELAKLNNHQKQLSDQISYLSTDKGVEAELRTKYRAVRDGESVAVIVDPAQTAQVGASASSTMRTLTWWQRLLQIIGL